MSKSGVRRQPDASMSEDHTPPAGSKKGSKQGGKAGMAGKAGLDKKKPAVVGAGGGKGAKPVSKGPPRYADSQEEGDGKKRRKKANYGRMDRYLYRLMKSVDPSFRISKKGMEVVNSFVIDILERLAAESAILIKKTGKITLKTHDAGSAALLVLPGELAKYGIAEGDRAVRQYRLNAGEDAFLTTS